MQLQVNTLNTVNTPNTLNLSAHVRTKSYKVLNKVY